jgi:hypothetical protein
MHQNMHGGTRVWSHGAGFDLPILHDVFRRLGEHAPWHYRNERDTRTLFMMFQKRNPESFMHLMRLSVGVAHHALDDAETQVNQVKVAFSSLR